MYFALMTLLTLASSAGAEGGHESRFWWLYYPGLEVWKFVNLLIFILALLFFLKKMGLSEAFRARREGIRRDLMRAQEERNAALAKLEEVETRLSRLDAEVTNI